MSVVGIDFGTSSCIMATIQRGAVTLIRNDLSERLTPSLVGFRKNERLIGDQAKTAIISNYANTCRYIKQLVGVSKLNKEVLSSELKHGCAAIDFTSDEEGGMAGYVVNYKDRQEVVSALKCLTALLSKLKSIAETYTGLPVRDVVISVPSWYSEQARQAVLDAAELASLNCFKVMNEHAAVALDYGIHRSNTFDEQKATRVAFIGTGHGSTMISVVDFFKGQFKLVSVATDKSLGGRDIDMAITEHLASNFQAQYGLNPMESVKTRLKLEEAASRIKRILSANSETSYNLECLMEDNDLTGMMKRSDFEAICSFFSQKLIKLLETVFSNDDVTAEGIHHIELIGGCSRVLFIQRTISEFFKDRLPLSRTLNMEETVARGCALQAAMLNPRYKVREFIIGDSLLEPVSVAWVSHKDDGTAEQKRSVLFPEGSALGQKKCLTFQRQNNFEVTLYPGSASSPLISQIILPKEVLDMPNIPKKVKIRAKLSLSSTVSWDSAEALVEEEVEKVVKQKKKVDNTVPTPQKLQTGDNNSSKHDVEMTNTVEAAPAEKIGSSVISPGNEKEDEEMQEVDVPQTQIRTRRFECQIHSQRRIGYLSPDVKLKLYQDELQMQKEDEIESKRKEALNQLESCLYEGSNKLNEEYSMFAVVEEKQQVSQLFEHYKEWLYENAEASEEEFVQKVQEIQDRINPIHQRYKEYVTRTDYFNIFTTLINYLKTECLSKNWGHIPSERINTLLNKVSEAEQWVAQAQNIVSSIPLHSNPTMLASEIWKEKEMLENFSKTILVPPKEKQSKLDEKKLQENETASYHENPEKVTNDTFEMEQDKMTANDAYPSDLNQDHDMGQIPTSNEQTNTSS